MKCPICHKDCVEVMPGVLSEYDRGDFYCTTTVLFKVLPKDESGVNLQESNHYIYDPVVDIHYIDLPPFRIGFCEEEVFVCYFKGVAGMQFERMFKTPPMDVTKKNIEYLIKRAEALVWFL
jgi:hypothetical protein